MANENRDVYPIPNYREVQTENKDIKITKEDDIKVIIAEGTKAYTWKFSGEQIMELGNAIKDSKEQPVENIQKAEDIKDFGMNGLMEDMEIDDDHLAGAYVELNDFV